MICCLQEKKAERKQRKQQGEAPGIPRTIESTREKDDTVLNIDEANSERIEEVNLDIENDEYKTYFENQYEPKVLITFADNPVKVILNLCV